MKWLLTALALLFAAPASAQGTITIAGNIQQNANGQPLAGALLYTYVINTVATAQLTYQDIGLTNANPWPLPADQNGRIPFFYLASGNVHVRLTDSAGGVQFDYSNMLVIGGASGGGGGGGQTVDSTTVSSTGDIKYRMSGESLAGWVILNGQTIGNSTSGATGLADDRQAQALYIYLWTNCSNAHCPVTPTGRGATALADFAAGHRLQLPDMRDSIPVGRDCMGSSCLGGILLSNIASGGGDTADTPGAFGGVANKVIAKGNLPSLLTSDLPVSLSSAFVTSLNVLVVGGSHTHTTPGQVSSSQLGFASGGGISGVGTPSGAQGATGSSGSLSLFGNGDGTNPGLGGGNGNCSGGLGACGGGAASYSSANTALPIMNPFKLGTWYVKL